VCGGSGWKDESLWWVLYGSERVSEWFYYLMASRHCAITTVDLVHLKESGTFARSYFVIWIHVSWKGAVCYFAAGTESADGESRSLISWLQNKFTGIVNRIRGNAALPAEHRDDPELVASGNEEVDGDTADSSLKPRERAVSETEVKSAPTASADVLKPVSFSSCWSETGWHPWHYETHPFTAPSAFANEIMQTHACSTCG